jgi:hypothetical protein
MLSEQSNGAGTDQRSSERKPEQQQAHARQAARKG